MLNTITEGMGALTRLALLCVLLFSAACTTNPQSESGAEEKTEATANQDKFESWNRKVFAFNDTVDRWFLKPAAKSYRAVAPGAVEVGISNFFDNLAEVPNVLNDVLQWKWGQAGNDTGRFLLNSTVGLAGFIDVARKAGLDKSEGEDFGQTLAVWGVPRGPYLVLPFLGPSALGELPAEPVDWYTSPTAWVSPESDRYILTATDIIQTRAELFDAEDLISGDRYIFVRDAWLQRRDYLINDGEIEDEFSDEFGAEFE